MSKKRRGAKAKLTFRTNRNRAASEKRISENNVLRRSNPDDPARQGPGLGYVSGTGRVGTRVTPMVGTIAQEAEGPGSYITHTPSGEQVLVTKGKWPYQHPAVATDEDKAARVRVNFDEKRLSFYEAGTDRPYDDEDSHTTMPFSDPGKIATLPSLYVLVDDDGRPENIAPGDPGSYAARFKEDDGSVSVVIVNPKGSRERGTVAAQLALLPGSRSVYSNETGETAVRLARPKEGMLTVGRYPFAADHVIDGQLKLAEGIWGGKTARLQSPQLIHDQASGQSALILPGSESLSIGKTPIDMRGEPHVPVLSTTQYGVTTATQVLEEMAKLYDMMNQRSWRHLVEDYYAERVLGVEVDLGWKPTPQEVDRRLRFYKDMVQSVAEALPSMTPYLWRSEVWSLTNELSKSYPEDTVWSAEMLHSPLMYWAMEHDVLLRPDSGDGDVSVLRASGFTGAFSMIVGITGTYDHQTGSLDRSERDDVITQVWMMICPELGTPVPMPAMMIPGERIGSRNSNERALAAKMAFLFSKLPEIRHEQAVRATRKRWERQQGTEPPELRMVALRQRERSARADGDDEGGSSTVDYSCRWMVRSHWHKYHTREGVITKLLGAYIKGPDDKPLRLKSDTIYNVGR